MLNNGQDPCTSIGDPHHPQWPLGAITALPLIIKGHGVTVDVNLAGESNLGRTRPRITLRVRRHGNRSDWCSLGPNHVGRERNQKRCDHYKAEGNGTTAGHSLFPPWWDDGGYCGGRYPNLSFLGMVRAFYRN